MMLNENIFKKVFSAIIKALIIFGSTFYIITRVRKQDLIDFKELLNHIIASDFGILLLVVTILLMVFNWVLESKKWNMLIQPVERQKFVSSIISVLSGLTFAIFTPNRLGEFGGRILQIEKGDRIKGAIAFFTGSLSQLMITILFGSISLLFYLFFDSKVNIQYSWPIVITSSILIFILNILLLMFFLNVRSLYNLIKRIKFFSKRKKYIVIFKNYRTRFLTNILLISLSRYLIFITQFYLLLLLFEVHIPFLQALYLISLMYLIATVVPTFSISEVVTRGSVSVYLLGSIVDKPIHITAAYFALWIVNLAIPALIGSLFIIKIKLFRKN